MRIGYLYRRRLRRLGFSPTKQGYKDYKKLVKKWFKGKTKEQIENELEEMIQNLNKLFSEKTISLMKELTDILTRSGFQEKLDELMEYLKDLRSNE